MSKYATAFLSYLDMKSWCLAEKSKRLLVFNAVVTTGSEVVVVGGTDGVSVVTTASGDAVFGGNATKTTEHNTII